MRGLLVVFEGLDQSGKQTQAERLRDHLMAAGRTVRLLSPEVLVDDGAWTVIRRRQTLDDVLALES